MINAPVQPGDVLANKYRVERVLGVGGMGVVVEATHVQLEERVALKFMLPEAMADAEVAGRFLREARLAVKLKSEHVAKVMDVGTLETGAPYIVMEFLEGTDLNHLLKERGPLPFADVAEYVVQACDAVAEAHAMGIVHRDLKPANLFLTHRPGGAPLVKVLDFGISKASSLQEAAHNLTRTSTMMGSPYFMSPEQMRSARDVDARSDVWSLGVILFQLLTARLPFEADTLGALMAAVLQDDPAMLSSFRPDVPHAFEVLVRRCLARDKNQRASNVGEIAMTLAPYAPARAKPIADRVVAVLGAEGPGTGVLPPSIGGAEAMTSSGSFPLAVLGAAPITGSGRVLGAAPPPDHVTGRPVTTTAWGRNKSRTGVVLGAIAGGIALAAVAFVVSRGAPARAPEETDPPRGSGVAAIEPAAEATATTASSATVTAPPAPAPRAAAAAAAPASTATTSATVHPAPAAAPPRAVVEPATSRPARPASPAPRASATPAAPPKKNPLDERN